MQGFYRYLVRLLFLPVVLLASCSGQAVPRPGENTALASFTDSLNGVGVSVQFALAVDGKTSLVATFTPPEGYHLYSKDIPRGGVRGQGRPTLIELPAGSEMLAAGALTESVGASPPGYNMDGPAVYPDGPVTLTLPITLPPQAGWVDDQVSLTYMACTALICNAPTVGRLLSVRIPGARALQP